MGADRTQISPSQQEILGDFRPIENHWDSLQTLRKGFNFRYRHDVTVIMLWVPRYIILREKSPPIANAVMCDLFQNYSGGGSLLSIIALFYRL